ncbi:Uncharacterised protein [Streptobacillus moniliformis]|nr:Uncharacterised protein [Streptobacillus moniliformis]
MKIFKNLTVFLLFMSLISYSNDVNKNINKLKKEVQKYEQNINKVENVDDEEIQRY